MSPFFLSRPGPVLLTGLALLISACSPPPHYRVAVDANWPPFCFHSQNRHIVGYEIDILNSLAMAGNFSFELVELPFEQIIDTVAAGAVDFAIADLSVTPERERRVAFTGSYCRGGQGLMLSPAVTTPVDTADDLRRFKICVEQGSTSEQFIRRLKPPHLVLCPAGECNDFFNDFKCEVLARERKVSLYAIRHQLVRGARMHPLRLTEESSAIAVPRDRPEVLERLNEGLQIIRESGRLNLISYKWFGDLGVAENHVP